MRSGAEVPLLLLQTNRPRCPGLCLGSAVLLTERHLHVTRPDLAVWRVLDETLRVLQP